MSRTLRVLVGLAVGALFLWWTLRGIDRGALAQVIAGVDWGALALAPVMLACGYAARVHRWRLMLRPHNPALGFGRAGVAFVASIAVNNLLPLRLGDALRCFGFSRWLGIAPGPVTASVLVERLLDLTALILALALALWVFGVSGGALGLGAGAVVVFAGLGALSLALLVWPALLGPVIALLVHASGLAGARIKGRVQEFGATLMRALKATDRLPLILWTLPVWVFEAACFWATARALPDLPVPQAGWLAMPVGSLSTMIPSTPGHLGPFDFFTQAAATALGNPLVPATGYALLIHAVLWLTTTLTGTLCLLVWALSQRRAPA